MPPKQISFLRQKKNKGIHKLTVERDTQTNIAGYKPFPAMLLFGVLFQ